MEEHQIFSLKLWTVPTIDESPPAHFWQFTHSVLATPCSVAQSYKIDKAEIQTNSDGCAYSIGFPYVSRMTEYIAFLRGLS